MASGKNYLQKPSCRFLSGERGKSINSEPTFEFDESELWNSNHVASPEFKKPIRSSRTSKRSSAKRVENSTDRESATASSLPVNIPDWSKILRDDYRDNRKRENDEDENDDEDDQNIIPPHEYLARQFARTRIASFSVHEGIGRTLKGRDLSRVRNAIWEKTGFED